MTYDQAKKAIYAYATVKDGYFGETAKVGVCYSPESKHTLIVADCGFFNSGLPPAIDQKESEWLLNNHPNANHIMLSTY